MSHVLTQASKDELATSRPDIIRVCKLHKLWYDADSRITLDLSDKVAAWGRHRRTSSVMRLDLEKPSMTVQFVNEDEQLNDVSASSWFRTAPDTDPRNVHMVVQIFVQTGDRGSGIMQEIFTFFGKIEQTSIVSDTGTSLVEITAIVDVDDSMRSMLTKRSGGINVQPNNNW